MNDVRIGVYVCHCGTNISKTIDITNVTDFTKKLRNVIVSREHQYMCSDLGQTLIKNDIKDLGLNRVIVASCSPKMHEQTFRKVLEEAGLNPYLFEMANIREQCSWVHSDEKKATEKAMDLIASAVAKVSHSEPLERKTVGVIPKALVIGGGVAGIYASLDLADKGFKTYLVEKGSTIGGHMAQLDKTFPTLDCSACILTPKMVEVDHHERIEMITYAEVEEVGGYIGNFDVKIREKCRYVDPDKCRGCIEDCASSCPIEVGSKFDLIGTRKAIYMPFPQAVPMVACIDPEYCIGCRRCEISCELDAVNYSQKKIRKEVKVGTIIVATGYDLFDASKEERYGYGVYDGVITGLELERLCNASGPTGGRILMHGKEPKDVVFIQCVGSRERGRNEYCSSVCCMYTAKHAHLIKERIPNVNVTILYVDIRSFGDGFEEFYERVKEEGVKYIRRELDDLIEVKRESDKLRVECAGLKLDTDLVVLATGIVPSESTKEVCDLLKIPQSEDGFFLEVHPKLRPIETVVDGVFIVGCCHSPRDIPDSIAQACGAAALAAGILSKEEIEIEPIFAVIEDEICNGCRICEGVCEYGALSLDEGKMGVNEMICKGCGLCESTCPSGAISVSAYNDSQILAEIEAML